MGFMFLLAIVFTAVIEAILVALGWHLMPEKLRGLVKKFPIVALVLLLVAFVVILLVVWALIQSGAK